MCIKERIVHLETELILMNTPYFGEYHPFSTKITSVPYRFIIPSASLSIIAYLKNCETAFTILSQNSSQRNVVAS